MKKNMNRVTGICLGVIDMKKSLQFYRDKLGDRKSTRLNSSHSL